MRSFLFLFAHVVVSQMHQLIYMNLNRSIFSLDQQKNLVGTRLNILHYFSSTIRSEKIRIKFRVPTYSLKFSSIFVIFP